MPRAGLAAFAPVGAVGVSRADGDVRMSAAPLPSPDLRWYPSADELRDALRRDAFVLHYQPICGSDNLDLVAYESLVRWRHPIRGMVPPQQFIAAAEHNGLIDDIGLWVLRRACRDLAQLDARYVGVNVSPKQLQSAEFASRFDCVIAEERVARRQVTIEITEGVPLHDGGTERRNLEAIRAGGSYLAIDDFGTGFASFDYLEKFPFNVLKVDKSFVDNITTSPSSRDAVAQICAIARERAIVVVAEGVETWGQLHVLRDLGCPRVQGYLLGRPAPADRLKR